ncbi:hypothetical protein M0804_011599 [Polistes exclamans]|nr:hypothetical protein M0804_011599 [Polistes exclamans]
MRWCSIETTSPLEIRRVFVEIIPIRSVRRSGSSSLASNALAKYTLMEATSNDHGRTNGSNGSDVVVVVVVVVAVVVAVVVVVAGAVVVAGNAESPVLRCRYDDFPSRARCSIFGKQATATAAAAAAPAGVGSKHEDTGISISISIEVEEKEAGGSGSGNGNDDDDRNCDVGGRRSSVLLRCEWLVSKLMIDGDGGVRPWCVHTPDPDMRMIRSTNRDGVSPIVNILALREYTYI